MSVSGLDGTPPSPRRAAWHALVPALLRSWMVVAKPPVACSAAHPQGRAQTARPSRDQRSGGRERTRAINLFRKLCAAWRASLLQRNPNREKFGRMFSLTIIFRRRRPCARLCRLPLLRSCRWEHCYPALLKPAAIDWVKPVITGTAFAWGLPSSTRIIGYAGMAIAGIADNS